MKTICLILYYTLAQHLPKSTAPVVGNAARRIRRLLCSRIFAACGSELNVENGVYIGNGRRIRVGNEVGLSSRIKILNREVSIGDYVMIGEETMILGGTHASDRTDIPISHQGELPIASLRIENDVWMGVRVLILPACKRIGRGVIVGAGAVLTKDVPDYAIVGGNPARVIRYRNAETNQETEQ